MGKVVLFHIDQFWKGLRSFAFSNRTIFEFIFLLIYTFEQMLLILFTSTVTKPEELSLIISLFAVIVLTTFSLHKMVMDSRIRILEEKVTLLHTQTQQVIAEYKDIYERYQVVKESLHKIQTKHLNRNTAHTNKKKEGLL